MNVSLKKAIALTSAILLLNLTACTENQTTVDPPPEVETEALETPKTEEVTTASLKGNPWQYLYDNREELQVCDGTIETEASQDFSETYAIAPNQALVQVLCFLAAYQGAYQYYLYTETDNGIEITPLELTSYIAEENGEYTAMNSRDIGGLPTYNTNDGTLTIFSKGRGLGDCGTWAQYQLKENTFELVEYRAKGDCDGNYVEPEAYPQVYP
ncbi:MAG: DUF1176 domain-containing protein [Jaaginema sp. PMC 1079.18]|nr:DUF1176 domain-containing protein [Jaaginema sp. PMC 1080.18]MEC4854024.1 DUF1176 domain-containing protein [Jaaginema sp. PMC 1079.18]MEC4864511.1 DUF1176 domain-containing protein [Jaaginema sp. PMC 1078.18]